MIYVIRSPASCARSWNMCVTDFTATDLGANQVRLYELQAANELLAANELEAEIAARL